MRFRVHASPCTKTLCLACHASTHLHRALHGELSRPETQASHLDELSRMDMRAVKGIRNSVTLDQPAEDAEPSDNRQARKSDVRRLRSKFIKPL